MSTPWETHKTWRAMTSLSLHRCGVVGPARALQWMDALFFSGKTGWEGEEEGIYCMQKNSWSAQNYHHRGSGDKSAENLCMRLENR